jgi:hypothetical protein
LSPGALAAMRYRVGRLQGLDDLAGMPVSDDQSAREAFTHALVIVSRISQLPAKANAQTLWGRGALR